MFSEARLSFGAIKALLSQLCGGPPAYMYAAVSHFRLGGMHFACRSVTDVCVTTLDRTMTITVTVVLWTLTRPTANAVRLAAVATS
jgi:hypothetical protein